MVWEGKGRRGAGIFEKGMGESRWRRVARFRLGNEMREAITGKWRKGRRASYVGERERDMGARMEDSRVWGEERGGWQEKVNWVLDEKDEGE